MTEADLIRIQVSPGPRSENLMMTTLFRELQLHEPDHVEVSEFKNGRSWLRRADVVHLHWPEVAVQHQSFLRSCVSGVALVGTLAVQRLRGAKIIRTRHDVRSHADRHSRLETMLRSWIDHRLSEVIVCGEIQRDKLPASLAGYDASVIALPPTPFPGAPDEPVAAIRRRLGLPQSPLVGVVGRVLPYKQVPHVVDVFRSADTGSTRLVVAGENLDPRMTLSDAPSTILRLDAIDLTTFQSYLQAVDVVVVAHAGHLNSSTALDALDQGSRLAVTRSPAMDELADRYPLWVRTIGDSDGLVSSSDLAMVATWAQDPPPNGPKPDLPALNDVVSSTIDVYTRVAMLP